MTGTVLILSQMPSEQLSAGMQQICTLQATPLLKLLQDPPTPPLPGVPQKDPVVWLDRLAAVFRYCQIKVDNGATHPCQPVVLSVWPAMSDACTKYQTDARVVERCCRCIRYAVRCLGTSSTQLLAPLVTQMVSLYASTPHSCFLYLGSILVDEYASDVNCVGGLVQMLEAFCVPTFTLLEKSSLREHPDTVDDLFRLCLRFVQRAPLALLHSPALGSIMRVAVAAATLDHKDANASVTKFLTELAKAAHEQNDRGDFDERSKLMRALLSEIGQSLMTAMINGCIFALPTFMMSDSAEVIYEMMQVDKQVTISNIL